jgi:hypothetical protein
MINGISLYKKIPYNLLLNLYTVYKLKNTASSFKQEQITKLRDYALNSSNSEIHNNFKDVKNLEFSSNRKGFLYTVKIHNGKIPDEYVFLDWSKYIDKILIKKLEGKVNSIITTSVCRDVYFELTKKLGSDKKVSLLLLENGIDGIKVNNNGKYTYVVFDPRAVEIQKKEKLNEIDSKTAYDQYYSSISPEIYEKIIQIDPTYIPQTQKLGKYTKWLLSNNVIPFIKDIKDEDLYKIRDNLAYYEKAKQAKKIPLELTDITKLTLIQFTKFILKFKKENPFASKGKEIQNVKGDSEKFDLGDWLIIIPKTKEAACYYGSNTEWCTASKENNYKYNKFDSYNSKGNLYICINKQDNRKYQFHFEVCQFMDENDNPIRLFSYFETYKNLFNFFKQRVPNMLDYMFNYKDNKNYLENYNSNLYKNMQSFENFKEIGTFLNNFSEEQVSKAIKSINISIYYINIFYFYDGDYMKIFDIDNILHILYNQQSLMDNVIISTSLIERYVDKFGGYKNLKDKIYKLYNENNHYRLFKLTKLKLFLDNNDFSNLINYIDKDNNDKSNRERQYEKFKNLGQELEILKNKTILDFYDIFYNDIEYTYSINLIYKLDTKKLKFEFDTHDSTFRFGYDIRDQLHNRLDEGIIEANEISNTVLQELNKNNFSQLIK